MSKELGQFFTINEGLQQYVFDHVEHKGAPLLEPSFGAGHLLKNFKEHDDEYPMECYEIDSSIERCINFNDNQRIVYGDFMSQEFDKKFKTIIGNPPYVKQSKGNLYIQFIEKCYHLLDDDDGELIFIVPSDFIKLTSASKIITEMVRTGSFTHFLFPNDEKLFDSASVDVVVFRYQMGVCQDIVNVGGVPKYCNVIDGILTLNDTPQCGNIVSNVFSTYVGLVSGRDEVYKMPFGMTDVLVDENNIEKFIFPTKFPTENEKIDKHLMKHKDELLGRKIKKFNENNWFEWGAPRNIKTMEEHKGRPCIYVRNLTRNINVAFKGTVTYFGGKLLCLIPRTEIDLDNIVTYLNSDMFKKNYMYAGRFKIGQRQLANAVLSELKKT
jgi:adenine-specific DNA-methyltransferase